MNYLLKHDDILTIKGARYVGLITDSSYNYETMSIIWTGGSYTNLVRREMIHPGDNVHILTDVEKSLLLEDLYELL